MLRSLAFLTFAALLLPAASDVPSDEPSLGSAAIALGNTNLVVSGTETRLTPGDSSPGSPSRPDAPPECIPHPVRVTSCGITAVRITNDDGVPLTISDVAQFAPGPVSPVGEPGDVGIAGLPTNFVASASVQTRAGSLLGRPISVRFTPVRFDFSYGDGTRNTSTSGGQTWPALGQPAFTPTSTSHSYRARGTYSATVTVHYTAEVDIGGGWFPVAGELAIDGTARQIRVYEAETALVARTCVEQPTAPGC